MGEYNGVVGGVSNIVAVDFKPWWEDIPGTVSVQHVDGRTLSPREAFERTLDWQVIERDLYIDSGMDSEPTVWIKVPNKKALMRADTRAILGVHSGSYGSLQNEWLCEILEAIKLVGDDVEIKSAGELFGGPVVWMLAKLGEDKHFIGRDERIAKYFAVSSSHDGSLAFTARPTDTRIECMNTFAMHLSDRAVVSVRHTSQAEDRMKQAKLVVDSMYAHSAELDAEIEMLINTEYTERQFKSDIVPAINPVPEGPEVTKRMITNWEKRNDGIVTAYNRPDAANIKGTAWGAVMGVNSYELWEQRVVKGTRAQTQGLRALSGKYPLTQQARALVTA